MRNTIHYTAALIISVLVLAVLLIYVNITTINNSNNNNSDKNETDKKKETSTSMNNISEKDFYYEPVSPEIEKRITGKSYPEGCDYSLDNLRYVKVMYYNFNNEVESGELIVNKSIAKDIVDIFKELFDSKYQIEKIKLIDEYNASDDASMEDNNTSAFNYRFIDGTEIVSDHSYGLAIDINPLYNPYVRSDFDDRNILPVNASEYADRTKEFKHKIEKGDVCYNAFISRGFLWGGDWNGETVDYQHFYKEQ